MQRINRTLQSQSYGHPSPAGHPRYPPCKQRPRMEPPRKHAHNHRRKQLPHPYPAQQLHLDRIRRRQFQHKQQRAKLHCQRNHLCHPRLLLRQHLPSNYRTVQVPRKQIRSRNRHDRRWHQRSNSHRRQAEPREPLRKHLQEQQRHRHVHVLRHYASCQCHIPQQRNQAQQKAIGGQHRRIPSHNIRVLRTQPRRRGMRIQHQRNRRPDRQRRVPKKLSLPQINGGRRRVQCKLLFRQLKHPRVPAQLHRDIDQRRQYHHRQHHVLHNRNHRRRTQPARVRICRQNHKRRGQRPLPVDPHRPNHDPDPHQLQCDIRHQRQHARQGNRHRQPAVPIPSADKVSKRYVTMTVTDRPKPRQHQHHVGIGNHRIWHGKESHRATAIKQRGHRNHGICRVQIATDQKPGHPCPEAAPSQPPLFQRAHPRLRPSPPRSPEPGQCHQRKEETEDHQRRRMQLQSFTQLQRFASRRSKEHLSATGPQISAFAPLQIRKPDQLRPLSLHSYTTTPRSFSVLITVSMFRRTSGRALTGTSCASSTATTRPYGHEFCGTAFSAVGRSLTRTFRSCRRAPIGRSIPPTPRSLVFASACTTCSVTIPPCTVR